MAISTTANLDLQIAVVCDECGADLEASQGDTYGRYNEADLKVIVEPCEVCVEEVREGAHRDGYEERRDEED
jgi:hypothetical protein